uniref:Uncharacterized protein n=1 Tax=viral metagenome TaxID=1070528 RepID=A0A6C0CSI2_9ZZZZ
MFTIKNIWNVVKKDDRILILMPNIKGYSSANLPSYLLREFQKTLHSIFKEKPKYIIALFPSIEDEKDYLVYENFYQYEIQSIKSLSVFYNESFQKYMKKDKLYTLIVNDMEEFLYHLSSDDIDIVLFDNPFVEKEYMQIIKNNELHCTHGRCYIDDFINAKIYLKKMLNKLMKPLQGMHQNVEDEYDTDIALVIGNNSKINRSILEEIIYELIKRNQLPLLITTDDAIYKIAKNILVEFKLRSRIHKITIPFAKDSIIEFNRFLKRVTISYTTYVFIGEFNFESKESKQLWDDKKKFLQGNCICDADALYTLFPEEQDIEKSKYRLTQHPLGMLHIFLNMEDDFVIDMKPIDNSLTQE